MKLVRLGTGRTITPFGDHVLDMPAGTGTLRDHHAALAATLGATVVDAASAETAAADGPALVLWDDVFVTHRLVRGLRKVTRGETRPRRVTLPKSRFVELYAQHQDVTIHADGSASYNAWWLPNGFAAGELPALLAAATPVVVPFREKLLHFTVPPNILNRAQMVHPLTTTVAFHLRHWVHVLWLGNLWPQIEVVERITRNPLSTAARLLTSMRPGVQATTWALARNFSYVGKNVSIHPTACVELSVLGDGCRVGPYALVRGSVLGNNVTVEERANVGYSVLGEKDFVSKNSTVFACVGFPNADLCINGMQYCMAGRRSALTSLVRPMDMKYRDNVRVRMDGKSVEIAELMVGSCFGHDTFIGPEVLIAPGREIPNGVVVAPRPGAVMTRVDPRLKDGGTACVVDGTLTPMNTSDP